MKSFSVLVTASSILSFAAAQTFQRLGGCPSKQRFPFSELTASDRAIQLWDASSHLTKPISWRVNTLTFVWRSTHLSMAQKPTEEFLIPTLPSPLRRAMALPCLQQATSRSPSQLSSDGTSPGMRIALQKMPMLHPSSV